MTDETTTLPPQLSPNTLASAQNLTRAKADVVAWTHNLEQALVDDVAAGRLTQEEAATVAKANGVEAPAAPEPAPEAHETTAEANQAQLDAHTKEAEAAAAEDQKTAAAAAPKPEPEPEPPPKAKTEDVGEKGGKGGSHRR